MWVGRLKLRSCAVHGCLPLLARPRRGQDERQDETTGDRILPVATSIIPPPASARASATILDCADNDVSDALKHNAHRSAEMYM